MSLVAESPGGIVWMGVEGRRLVEGVQMKEYGVMTPLKGVGNIPVQCPVSQPRGYSAIFTWETAFSEKMLRNR